MNMAIRRRKKRHAKRANPVKRRKHRARRRRGNPGMVPLMLANPRRRRRHRKVRSAAPVARRRRRRGIRRGKKALRIRRRRSRSSPLRLGAWKGLIRLGLFGGLGIIAARVGSYGYKRYLASYVSGGNTTGARAILSDVARIAAMAAVTVAVSKAAKKMAKPGDAQAILVGGMAETGRQAVGVLLKQVAPSVASFEPLAGMGELEASDSFMGEIEDADSFMGEEELAYDNVEV